MALETVPAALTGFKRLASSTSIYIYEPPTTLPSPDSSSPDLVVLPTWLDAAPRHIAKYTKGYQTLYPHARILLITTAMVNVIIHSRRAEAQRIAPALSLLIHLPPSAKILLHSFSNGGAYVSHLLATSYKASTGRPLPISAQIFDSAPGRGHYGRTATALALGLPRTPRLLYYVGLVMLHLFLATSWVANKVSGGVNRIEVVREGLLDGGVWDRGVPRAYVFSRGDQMVLWEDVVDHAERAEEIGWKRVSVEEFVGSGHCGHLMIDEGRYWGVVERVWGER